MIKKILPLHYFDDHGQIKPPPIIWLVLLLSAKAYFVLLASLSNLQDKSVILQIIYPNNNDFYHHLVVGLPACLVAVILSFREKIVLRDWHWLFRVVIPLLLLSLCCELLLQTYIAQRGHWQFQWSVALSLLSAGLSLVYCLRSKRIRIFIDDWRQRTKADLEENKHRQKEKQL